jgi:LacI family transcriptional regulator
MTDPVSSEPIRKPRIRDLAKEAGVGTATVERVLNARGNVSSHTMQRVLLAARKLGYERVLPTPHHALVRIEVILVRPDTEFFSRLSVEFQRLSQHLDRLIVVHRSFIEEDAPALMARRIRDIAHERSGLVVVAQDHPAIIAAVQDVVAGGVPVVLLVSRLNCDGKAFFVGIDNESAGRTAGYFMWMMLRFQRGRILAICHSGIYGTHRQRISGFSQYFEGADAPLCFSYCITGRDSEQETAKVVGNALAQFGDVIGIYNAGGAHKGVERALRAHNKLTKIAYIGHELSPDSRRLLQSDGMCLTIDQMPELQAQRAIEILERAIGLRAGEIDYSPIPFRIATKENLAI